MCREGEVAGEGAGWREREETGDKTAAVLRRPPETGGNGDKVRVNNVCSAKNEEKSRSYPRGR